MSIDKLDMTTMWISRKTLNDLEKLRIHKRETNGDIIQRLVTQEIERNPA